MVDVFHLTTSETSFARAQLMRIELIDSFFKMLPKRELALVEKKLFATLSSLDSALVSMLFPGKGMATVTNIDVARPKGAPPSARARKQRISAQSAAVRNGMKGAASGGGNGKQKRK
jgi:hypothetical protein